MAKAKTPEQDLLEHVAELEKSFANWQHINEFGCSDPFWEDGANMNLVRNHILHHKRQIAEICEAHHLPIPKVCTVETPLRVDSKYMANADGIRQKALACMAAFDAEPSIRELIALLPSLRDDMAEKGEALLRDYRSLRDAIQRDHLVTMRRYREVPDRFENLRAFLSSISEVDFEPQTSLFALLDDGDRKPAQARSRKPKRHAR